MPSDLYWIDPSIVGRLAIMARPRAGDWLEDEVAAWRQAGVDSKLVFEAISAARGVSVPDTEGQRDWLVMFQSRATDCSTADS